MDAKRLAHFALVLALLGGAVYIGTQVVTNLAGKASTLSPI